MRKSPLQLKSAGFLAALLLSVVPPTWSQGGPPRMEGKTAEQVFKNIKVLTGTPADQLNEAMHLIKGAVGLDCEACHDARDRAADTKKDKEIARDMMRMVIDINKNSFKGQQVVTCYTCHRGRPDPVAAPVLPLTQWQETPEVPLPPLDQILAKYVQALGGEQAVRKITSRVITGTQFIPTGPGGTVPVPAMIERDQKAPNLLVNTYRTPTYTISDGFDGTNAWSQDQRGRVTEPTGIDQARAKRGADFYLPLDLRQEYTQMIVQGVATVNGHDTYMVIAQPQGDRAEQLYFDTTTGLLVRKRSVLPTPVGDAPYQVDYDDYRDTGSGVKFPYMITMNPAIPSDEVATNTTIRVTKVEDNVPIDSSKFAKPESTAAAR